MTGVLLTLISRKLTCLANKFFSEEFADEDRSFVTTLLQRHDGPPICSTELTTEKVFTKLSSLNSFKLLAAGPDGCHVLSPKCFKGNCRTFGNTVARLLAICTLSKPF